MNWLHFLLCYPVAKERQRMIEAIPEAALDEFLARETTDRASGG